MILKFVVCNLAFDSIIRNIDSSILRKVIGFMSQQNEIIENKHLITSETDTLNYGKTNSVEKTSR